MLELKFQDIVWVHSPPSIHICDFFSKTAGGIHFKLGGHLQYCSLITSFLAHNLQGKKCDIRFANTRMEKKIVRND